VRKTHPGNPRLIESYCATCGLLIAASPSTLILRKIESVHACPVYFTYPRVKRA
jgi:hypothetical protein